MISTHILDATVGRPAQGVAVRLFNAGRSDELASTHTDADGRATLATVSEPGAYRIVFDTGAYFEGQTFYPEVIVTFTITDPAQHHHVPLLLSPFAYSTYRGS